MVLKAKKTSRSRLKWKPVIFVVVLVLIVVAALEITGVTHFFHKSDAATKVVVKAGKITPAPVNNVSKGEVAAAKDPASNASRTEGGAKDTQGSVSASTDSSKWVLSESGNITVKQPLANAKIQSGSVLSGSSKLDKVNFRLIDNKVGIIAQGTLNVVNGNFSGSFSFTPQASNGRLDVFSTDAQGVEINEVQIAVVF